MAKGWPKGVPRKQQNVNKESAVNPFQPREVTVVNPEAPPNTEPVIQTEANPQDPEAPHFLENQPKFRAFNDRDSLEDKYAKYLGLENQGEQQMETAEDKIETPPPAEADTGVDTKTSETIEVKADEPVVAPESTLVQPQTATPESVPPKVYKHKTIEEAEKAANEAERKMHEATQERARIETEKKSLEAFNKQMLEVLQAMKSSAVQLQPQQPKQEEIELTPEQKTELIINNPDEFERIVTQKAKREILGEIERRQKQDQEQIQLASQQRGIELFVRMGEQHFENTYQDMKVYEPFVKEEAEKILKSPEARELITQKGPTGLIDQAVINTKARIEQIRQSLSGSTPPAQAAPVNSGEVRTPIPASPVVKPSGVIPAPVTPELTVPSPEQITKDYVAERNAWRQQRGLG